LPRGDLAEEGQRQGRGLGDQLDHQSANEQRQAGAEVDAHTIKTHRGTQLLVGKAVGNHGHGGRCEGGLADSDPHASEKKTRITRGDGAGRRHQAPEKDACRDDVAAIEAVHQATGGQADQGVE
jgi:hypothetical protein